MFQRGPGRKDARRTDKKLVAGLALLLAYSGTSAFATGNLLPAAHAGPDVSGSLGQSLGFSGNSSHDPDGSIVSYQWTFGDGANASGNYVTHAYAAIGTYTVTLTVTDNQGATSSDTATAYVCPSIRSAIDAASPGSLIQLAACTYIETVNVNKSVTLRGGANVTFDGDIGQSTPRSGPVFTISAANVSLENIFIRDWQGAYINGPSSNGLRLRNVTTVGPGSIDLYQAVDPLFERSQMTSMGIYASLSTGFTFQDSQANEINLYNSNLFRVTNSTLNYIYANSANGRIERAQSYVSASGNVIIEYSTVRGANLGEGATMRTSTGASCYGFSFNGAVLVERNTLNANCGLSIGGTSAIFRYNQVTSGTLSLSSSSSQAFVYLNNFQSASASDSGFENRFDTGSIGNYWSDHTSPDTNNDSIVDNPRNISGSAANQDHYPLTTPFGGLPPVNAVPPNVTAAPDALVDASLGVLIPMAGLQRNASYDLTITNITPSGVGFGYGSYGYGGGPSELALRRPNGSIADLDPYYNDSVHAGKVNVTYPDRLLDTAGLWTVTANGYVVASFNVDPPFFPPTSAPNPSGPNATVRAYDVQEMRVSFPVDARIRMQHAYDLTFTNITTAGGQYQIRAPNATNFSTADAYVDGLHSGRLNATFPSIAFPVSGLWTLRSPDGSTVAAFDVDAPPGVNAFVANLTLALGNRTDGAAFGAAINATDELDPAHDVAEPPTPTDPYYVRLFLPTPSGTELHRSVIGANGTLLWPLHTRAAGLSGLANVTWTASEIATINDTFDVELLDGATTVDMRLATSHAFSLDGSHNLSIRVRQTAGLRLDASAVIVTPVVQIGAQLRVNGTVQNDGPDAAVSVRVTLELDNGTNYTIDAVPSTIPAGGVGTFSFAGVVQTVAGDHTATVRVNSSSADSNPANNVVTKAYFVTTFLVDLDVLGAPAQNVTLGANATYTVRVRNEGNTNETISLSLSGVPPGWNASLSASSILLAPNENATVDLLVNAPTIDSVEPRARIAVTGEVVGTPLARDSVQANTTLLVTRSIVIPQGWALRSISVAPADNSTAAVFGASAMAYGWNGTAYTSASTISVGRGYWVYSDVETNRNVTGIPQRNVTLILTPGWNLVGTPLAASNLSSAPANVSRSAFTWGASGYEETTQLAPIAGYWVYSHNSSATFVIGVTGAGGASSSATLGPGLLPRPPPAPEFSLSVRFEPRGGGADVVHVGSARGASAAFGLEDLPKMPAAVGRHVRASLAGVDAGQPIELHRDMRSASLYHAWAIDVDRMTLEGPVEVAWDLKAVAAIPLAYRVELQDGPVRIDMRLVDRYVLRSDDPTGHHDLRLVVASYLGEPACALAIDGECIAWTPVDPTRALLGVG